MFTVAPPGWEKQVEEMKKNSAIENPFALAWHLKDKQMQAAKMNPGGTVPVYEGGVGGVTLTDQLLAEQVVIDEMGEPIADRYYAAGAGDHVAINNIMTDHHIQQEQNW